MSRGGLVIGGIVAMAGAIAAWKGREIRALLSLTGRGWDRLHPEVKRRALRVLERAHAEGLPVGVFEGWRSAERQRELMRRGNSWVGDPDSSYHRWGLAVDFVFLDPFGRWTWDRPRADWEQLGRIIEAEGFEWGGRWRRFDGPHAQLPLLSIAELKDRYQVPERYVAEVAAA